MSQRRSDSKIFELRPLDFYASISEQIFQPNTSSQELLIFSPNTLFRTLKDLDAQHDLGNNLTLSRARRLFKNASKKCNSGRLSMSQSDFIEALIMLDLAEMQNCLLRKISLWDAFFSFSHTCNKYTDEHEERPILHEDDLLSLIIYLKQTFDSDYDCSEEMVLNFFQESFQKHPEKGISYIEFLRVWCYRVIKNPGKILNNYKELACSFKKSQKFVLFLRSRRSEEIETLIQLITYADKVIKEEFLNLNDEAKKYRHEHRKNGDKAYRFNRWRVKKCAREQKIGESQIKRENKKLELERHEASLILEHKQNQDLIRRQKDEQELQLLRNQKICNQMVAFEKESKRKVKDHGYDRLLLKNLNCENSDLRNFFKTNYDKALLSNLVLFNLSGNQISELPETGIFYFMRSLRKLDLSKNKLKAIPLELFTSLTSLQIFDASNNELEIIPEHISTLRYLSSIKVNRNKLEYLPKNIGCLSHLRLLDVSSNKLRTFPESICTLTWLITLNASKNQLARLPDDIGFLYNLQHLNLEENDIQMLPTSIVEMKNLVEIKISENSLKVLHTPDTLMDLDCSRNFLETIQFTNVNALTHLQSINFSGNKLSRIPKDLGALHCLIECQLASNNIYELGENFSGLSSLEILDVSKNRLTLLPKNFGLLRNLRRLNLSSNQLENLPHSLGYIEVIIELNLSKNRLKNLPDTLSNLTYLRSLDVSFNCIKGFAKDLFCGISENIEYLNACCNNVRFLPRNCWSMFTKIMFLSLRKNMLEALPLTFINVFLKNPNCEVDINNNPFRSFPPISFMAKRVSIMNLRQWLVFENDTYHECCIEWEMNKMKYLHKTWTFKTFLLHVIYRKKYVKCSPERSDQILRHIQDFYFSAKTSGVIPCYHYLSEEDAHNRRIEIDNVKKWRASMVLHAKEEYYRWVKKKQDLYSRTKSVLNE